MGSEEVRLFVLGGVEMRAYPERKGCKWQSRNAPSRFKMVIIRYLMKFKARLPNQPGRPVKSFPSLRLPHEPLHVPRLLRPLEAPVEEDVPRHRVDEQEPSRLHDQAVVPMHQAV